MSAIALQASGAAISGASLETTIDGWCDRGLDLPAQSISALDILLTSKQHSVRERRLILVAEGLVAAHVGLAEQADAVGARLASEPGLPRGLVDADRELIRTELAAKASLSEQAYAHGRAALRGYESECTPAQSLCDYRSQYAALRAVAWGAEWHSANAIAVSRAQGMLDLARAANDRRREALAVALQAVLSQIDSDSEQAQRLLARASELARLESDPRLDVDLGISEAFIARDRKDYDAARFIDERALSLAEREGFTNAQQTLRINLGDVYIKLGRLQDALRTMAPALELAQRANDLRRVRYLRHNMTLARIGLGMSDGVRADITADLATWAHTGAPKERLEAFQELSAALEAIGQHDAALELFRQEQELVFATGDEHELLARQSHLREQERDEHHRALLGWIIASCAGLAAAAAVALLATLLRARNRRLATNNEALRHHAERDPLTGLLNREGFLGRLDEASLRECFVGTLVMIDIDHFKSINDSVGHAGGDAVLAEVARRLQACVRDEDLIVRWGGEEMVVAVRTKPFEPEALLGRLMHALAATPVVFDRRAIQVTASIGYASFPLDGQARAFTFDQSLALVDGAMFHAKRTGRRSAVRLIGLQDELLTDLAGLLDNLERDIAACRVRVRKRKMDVPDASVQDGGRDGPVGGRATGWPGESAPQR